MIVCDYCGDRITDFPVMMVGTTDTATITGNTITPPAARIDLHQECVTPYQAAVSNIHGKRPHP